MECFKGFSDFMSRSEVWNEIGKYLYHYQDGRWVLVSNLQCNLQNVRHKSNKVVPNVPTETYRHKCHEKIYCHICKFYPNINHFSFWKTIYKKES